MYYSGTVVREPTPALVLLQLQWDEVNEEHLAEHDVTIEDVEEVRQNAPRFFLNLPDRSGTHVMIGPRFDGRFFYIALAPTNEHGRWRPITGWSMNTAAALKIYRRERRK